MKPSAACSSEALQRIRHADGPKDGGCAFIIDREVPFEAAKHRLEIDEADDRGVIVDQIDPSAGLVDQEIKRIIDQMMEKVRLILEVRREARRCCPGRPHRRNAA